MQGHFIRQMLKFVGISQYHNMHINKTTFMVSRACEDILGNFFSKGEISFTSGSLIPTNSGFLRNTSLWRGVKLPERYHMHVIYSGAPTSKILIDDSNHTRLAYTILHISVFQRQGK